MNNNPDAEDTRGGVKGLVDGVDDMERSDSDVDDDDEGDEDRYSAGAYTRPLFGST
jgi:hypothetical protein